MLNSPLGRIDIRRPSKVVAEELRAAILYGEMRNLDRLPPEPEVAEQLGISRHHLREALRLLEEDGLIEIRRGHNGGIFLTGPRSEVLSRTVEGILIRNGVPLSDILATCKILGPACGRLAALNATTSEIDEIENLVVRQEEAGDVVPDLATRFHEAIARASHNETLTLMMLSIEPLLLQLYSMLDPQLHFVGYQRRLRAIVTALRSRDAERVAERMRRYISVFEDHLRATGLDPSEGTFSEILLMAQASNVRGPLGGRRSLPQLPTPSL